MVESRCGLLCSECSYREPYQCGGCVETFFTQNNKASVCYTDGENNVTLLGIVDILTDPDLKEQLWLDWFIHYFPGGVTDPNYCLLKFTTKEVHYWIDKQDGHFSW